MKKCSDGLFKTGRLLNKGQSRLSHDGAEKKQISWLGRDQQNLPQWRDFRFSAAIANS